MATDALLVQFIQLVLLVLLVFHWFHWFYWFYWFCWCSTGSTGVLLALLVLLVLLVVGTHRLRLLEVVLVKRQSCAVERAVLRLPRNHARVLFHAVPVICGQETTVP